MTSEAQDGFAVAEALTAVSWSSINKRSASGGHDGLVAAARRNPGWAPQQRRWAARVRQSSVDGDSVVVCAEHSQRVGRAVGMRRDESAKIAATIQREESEMLRRATRRSGAVCRFRPGTISGDSGAARRGGLMHPTSRPSGCASCSRCHRSGTELRSGLVQSPPPRRACRMRRRDHSNRPVHGSEPFHHAGAAAAALQMSCGCSETLPGQPAAVSAMRSGTAGALRAALTAALARFWRIVRL